MDAEYEVVIVGTGFAGLCMAIRLLQRGERRFVLLERAESVGGTWRDNRYPGAACDIPSHLYSLSFAPNPDWSRKYPTQPELRSYLEDLAERFGILPFVRFGAELLSARYDEAAQRWQIHTPKGDLVARSLVSATGGLSEPKLPDIPGLERFQGQAFHSSRWDTSYDLAGKRVAVIGTGASAIQLVPEIVGQVARLDLYQRTPSWVIPRFDRPYLRLERWMFRYLPLYRRLHRAWIYWAHELPALSFVGHPALMRLFQRFARAYLARQVPEEALRARLTPGYAMGCKRILVSNDWYPALQRPNVSLVTESIREIRERSVVTADGVEREVDCLVFATGFYATENPNSSRIVGRAGQSLAEAWADGEEAYLGTAVKGFPNLFLLVGPNTGLGHNSMVFVIETQVDYVARALERLLREGGSLEVRAETHDRYNQWLQEQLRGSIWATGCRSWYQHRSGKITALWPGFTFGFWWRVRFRVEDYRETPA